MSAAVCGSKRSFFEELPSPQSPPVTSKRLRRCSSSSPIRFSPPTPVDQLRAMFPHLDTQVLEKALFECDNDLDSAIKSLHQLCLASTEERSEECTNLEQGTLTTDGDVVASENPSIPNNLPVDGVEWVRYFVNEMMSASSMDDARARASRVLEIFEKSISSRAGAEAAQSFQKENMMLKEHTEVLIRENHILKRAVAIQHERQKEFEDKNQELHHLKQMLSQYQDQLRTLELNNYALTMHLRQAQQSNSILGRFHPDVF